MNQQKPRHASERRVFLKGIVAAGGATALTAVGASRLGTHADSRQQAQETPASTSRGYRETPHIRAYYRTLRS